MSSLVNFVEDQIVTKKDAFVDDYGNQNSLLNRYKINEKTLYKKMISLIKN